MSVNLWDESDSEDELLPGWQQLIGSDGRVLYLNSRTGSSSLVHPVSGRSKQVSAALPAGWSKSTDQADRLVFIHDTSGRVSYIDPRLLSTTSRDSRTNSRFDQFSTASDVLRNKDLRGKFMVVTGSGCGLGKLIATNLASYGATVICACARCPPDARRLTSPDLHSVVAHPGDLFWIPCDLNDLSTVIQFGQIYARTGWPINVCILTSDHFPVPISHSLLAQVASGLLKPLNILCNLVKVSTQSKAVAGFARFLRQLFHWFVPIESCECGPSSGLTSDHFEVTIQRNFLAQMLLLYSLGSIIERTNRTISDSVNRCRIVLLSGESYRSITEAWFSNHLDQLLHFQLVPSGLSNRLHYYAGVQLLQILFLSELQKRFQTWSQSDGSAALRSEVFVCDVGTILTVHCVGFWWKSMGLFLVDPIVSCLRLIRMLLSPFTQSSTQLIASPCFCATDDSVLAWKKLKAVARVLSSLVYVTACQQKHLSSDTQFSRYADRIWEATMHALSRFINPATPDQFVRSPVHH